MKYASQVLMTSLVILMFTSALVPAVAQDDDLAKALTEGDVSLDVRYRYETVEQGGFANGASASTLRTKLAYKTGKFYDFAGLVEIENVAGIGNDDEYNSTTNGNGAFPVVADPRGTEINQAALFYTGFDNTTLIGGRQKIQLDNQRFVGAVGFRQNDQTFDGVTIKNTAIDNFALQYAYIWNVNRIQGDDHANGDWKSETHLINAKYSGLGFGTVSAYAYLINPTEVLNYGSASQTYGIRFAGKTAVGEGIKAVYEVELAQQSDYGDNPTSYSALYYHGAAGLSASGFTAKLGYEVMGSDEGVAAFQTPLATGHKFSGWADKFLSTPANGLEDLYAAAIYKHAFKESFVDKVKVMVVYHDFRANDGGADYGSEWDAVLNVGFYKNFYVEAKYADYQADTHATDTQKMWLAVGAKF